MTHQTMRAATKPSFTRAMAFAFALLLTWSCYSIAPAQAAPWRMSMRQVNVQQQRESGGDRPYFVTFQFESRLFLRGTTRVDVIEAQPHDWVDKAEHRARGRVSSTRSHLFNGEVMPLPAWMGELGWGDINVVPQDAASILRSNPHVFGAIVIGFDNNNTPPHVIRNAADQIATWLKRFLQQEVEGGRIINVIDLRAGTVNEAELRAKFEAFGRSIASEIDAGKVIENAFQLTLGSTFNPDKIVGIHALIFPAIAGIPVVERSEAFSAPLVGENVNWSVLVGTAAPISRTLLFQGSGARYAVPFRLTNSILPDATTMSSLQLRIATGEDDLRTNSRLSGFVTLRDGRRSTVQELNGRRGLGAWSEFTTSIELPRDTRFRDLQSLTLSFASGSTGPFDTTDNYNIDSVAVMLSGGAVALKVVRGRPLVRFTGDSREFTFALR